MANTLKFGNGLWATKEDSVLAYNDENGNYKPLPFEFERDTNATVVNKKGLIETVGKNIPRIDFQGNNKGALLLEPERTNEISYSEDFSQWIIGGDTVITDNVFISPDGTQNAASILLTTSFAYSQVTLSVSIGDVCTFSCFVNSSVNKLTWGGGTPDGTDVYSYEDYGNGWYRQILTRTFIASGAGIQPAFLYLVSGTSLFYIYGAQLEEASYPTSYIPTQGGTVTRAADVCANAGNDQVINSTEGVLYAEISALANINTFKNISINNNGATNRINLYIYASTVTINFDVNGLNQANMSYTLPNVSDFNKIAFSYKLNQFKLFVNGVQRGSTDTSGIVPSSGVFNTLSFNDGGLSKFFGKTKDIKVYTTALTDQELIALTTI